MSLFAARYEKVGKLTLATSGVFVIAAVVIVANHHQSSSSAATLPPAKVMPQQYDNRITQPTATFNLTIGGTKLASGPNNIVVHKGDSVRVNIAAANDEVKVRLAGYDIITEASPGDDTGGAFSFIADTAGSFPFYAIPEQPDGQPQLPDVYLGTIEVK